MEPRSYEKYQNLCNYCQEDHPDSNLLPLAIRLPLVAKFNVRLHIVCDYTVKVLLDRPCHQRLIIRCPSNNWPS